MSSLRAEGRRWTGAIAVLLGVLGASGCGLLSPESVVGGREERLAEARERWRDTGLESYAWTVDQSCYCGSFGLVEVRVVDGRKASVVRIGGGPEVTLDQARWFPTVEELFDVVEQALEDAAAIEVRFDDLTGVPLLVDIDWVRNAIDDEIVYATTRPVPLENDPVATGSGAAGHGSAGLP